MQSVMKWPYTVNEGAGTYFYGHKTLIYGLKLPVSIPGRHLFFFLGPYNRDPQRMAGPVPESGKS